MNRFTKVGVLGTSLLLSLSILSTTAKAADYTVLSNDSLYRIGTIFDSDVNTLKSTNALESDVIYRGQIINVPANTYEVKSGDTLFNIALQNNISLLTLREANNIWDDLILPGQILLIPESDNLMTIYKDSMDYINSLDKKSRSTNANSTNNTSSSNSSNSSNSASSSNSSNSSNSSSSSNSTSNKESVISYTKEELDLLARLITAEATGQPYKAMVSVGSVVVNRVQSNEWPSSIKSVINHVAGGYYQFTPVKNGYINNPASSEALKAAKEALTGTDPSYGALFFFDDSSTNDWLWSKNITARYGDMVYAK